MEQNLKKANEMEVKYDDLGEIHTQHTHWKPPGRELHIDSASVIGLLMDQKIKIT